MHMIYTSIESHCVKFVNKNSKFCTIVLFIHKTIIHAEFVGVFTIYTHTKFHMPSYNGSLVTTFNPKSKYIFRVAAILFYILRITSVNFVCFSMTYYHTKLQDLKLSSVSIVHKLKIRRPPCR